MIYVFKFKDLYVKILIVFYCQSIEVNMKTITTKFNDLQITYPIEKIAEPEEILFLDIETTGLTAKNSNLYLIGCAFYKDEMWQSIQWFAENYEEELSILTAFFTFMKDFKYLIHYNGNKFDIPYLIQKCEQFSLEYNFDNIMGVDIFRRIMPYKDLLGLIDLKQKTIEDFLEIDREDEYSGRELISIYHNYVCNQNDNDLNNLMLHNEEDLKGMLSILSMLSYSDLFNNPIRVMKAQANYFNNENQKRCQEIVMKLRLESPLPKQTSFRALGCYFSGNGVDCSLKVPLFEEELKYYYSNYKNYYYLPAEDIAMHKSVATFVDKAHRVQASPTNCYTRKKSMFLPEWDVLFTPFFKRDYKEKELFFELTDDFKKSRAGFAMYAEHVLTSMLQYYS